MSSPERLPAFRTFGQDLGQALKVWRGHPRLPLLALLIEGGPYIVTAITYWLIGYPGCDGVRGTGCGPLLGLMPWLTAIFMLVFLGWYGTQRIWYLRAFRGGQFQRGEFWPLNSAFRGRYFRLGILSVLAMVPGMFLALAIGGYGGVAVFITWTFAVDAALTFVTPALAFSTRSAFEALRAGLQLARRTWPASALYILIPPLAIRLAAATVSSQRSAVILAIVADTISVLLLCWFRGATARFYLRYNETEDDGAALENPLEGTMSSAQEGKETPTRS
jgi:hypothetical protein